MNLIDLQTLKKFDRAVPRYTSYPTAPQFYDLSQETYQTRLKKFDRTEKPLSLYFHIPFCRSMCLFCGCSVVLNRKPEKQSRYLNHLMREIELVTDHFSKKRFVSQLHFGGGTPTSLTEEEFDLLMQKIHDHFVFTPEAEISIEIDPRTVYLDGGKKLAHLKKIGFNRVSFGVQDLDPKVQEAVKRRQSEEMTLQTFFRAKELGFSGINIDLIYGLPLQSPESFEKTARKLTKIKPDRIAFYSYAKVPWLKKHQKAIPDKFLPSREEKLKIYLNAREIFINEGYTPIGMDHFALNEDLIAKAYREKKLTRNFQGYSVELAEDMIGFGLSSIGLIENCYFQNVKELDAYQKALQNETLPIFKGYLLKREDVFRREIILSIMCHFEIEKKYAHLADLNELILDGLIEEKEDRYTATDLGKVFIRIVASKFDAYLQRGKFSSAV